MTHADLGGRPDERAVVDENEGNPFHHHWEERSFALTLACGAFGLWNIDMSRSARETLPNYLELTYYRIWLEALVKLLKTHHVLAPIAGEFSATTPSPVRRVLKAADVETMLAKGTPFERPPSQPARFAIGERVRMRALTPEHHSRVPGYVLGKVGEISRVHGAHVFAESSAQGMGEDAQWLYTVVFDHQDLFDSPDQPAPIRISVDAWETTLEAA